MMVAIDPTTNKIHFNRTNSQPRRPGESVIVTEIIKKGILNILSTPAVYRLFSPFTRNNAIIFVLHRFEDKENDVHGISANLLEEALVFLKQEGYHFVSLEDIIQSLDGNSPALSKAVCFTIDDGFLDQATIAAPIFEKHQCPLTIFLITDFIDGKLWPWDDQVRYMFTETKKTSLKVKVGNSLLIYGLTQQSRLDCAREFREICKELPEEEMLEAIETLSQASDIAISSKPPKSYQPMNWDIVRALENKGVIFGNHGLSHRIISRMTSERVKKEIGGSWQRLKQELSKPLKVFCFATGRYNNDFTIRDMNMVKNSGFKAALSTDSGYINLNKKYKKNEFPYKLDRFTFPDNKSQLIQYCSGIEQMKGLLRKKPLALINKKYGGKIGFLNYQNYRVKYFLGGFREQANIDWSNVTRLVFICKGNICRSPFAEFVSKSMNIDALSFGVDTRGGDLANHRATEIAREFDIDLTRHITTRIEEYNYKKNDLIISMEPAHIKIFNIKQASYDVIQHTLLGLWGENSHPYIHDPYSADDEYFRGCFKKIQGSIEHIVMFISEQKQIENDDESL